MFKRGYRAGYAEAAQKRALKKAMKTMAPGSTKMYYRATGLKERDALLAEGWELIGQDTSLNNIMITAWFLQREVDDANLSAL